MSKYKVDTYVKLSSKSQYFVSNPTLYIYTYISRKHIFIQVKYIKKSVANILLHISNVILV